MRYKLLGHTGLRVSEVSLGAMTFGQDWGWGSSEEESRRIFDAFLEAGGNFVDTASIYTNGTSERFLGTFMSGQRERIVLATKYSGHAPMLPVTDPNVVGNHRKNLVQTVETSLRNLKTDYIDVLYVHAWDYLTPVEEVMRALDDLVRAGKVLYLGISDTPAWIISRGNTLASLKDWSPFVVTQIEYNLIERTAEREIIPMTHALDIGVTAWSPLAGGLLTGKYATEKKEGNEQRRLDQDTHLDRGNARVQTVVQTLTRVAQEINATPAQVALAWLIRRGIIPIIGARTLTQFQQNLGVLDVTLPDEAFQSLNDASKIEMGFPHEYALLPFANKTIYGGYFGKIDMHRPNDIPEAVLLEAEKYRQQK